MKILWYSPIRASAIDDAIPEAMNPLRNLFPAIQNLIFIIPPCFCNLSRVSLIPFLSLLAACQFSQYRKPNLVILRGLHIAPSYP